MTRRKDALWSVPFVLATVTNLLLSTVFMGLLSAVALYAVARFQASEGLAGLAAGAFVLGAIVSRVFLARFIDSVGRRRMLLIGLAAYLATSLLYFVADSMLVLLIVRLIHGVAFGLAHTALTTAVMAMIPARRRAEGTGYYGIASALVTAIGPLAAVLLTSGDASSGTALFTFTTACSLVALVLAAFIKVPEAPQDDSAPRAWWRYRMSDIFEPAAVPIGVIILISGAGFTGIIVFLTAYSRALGYEEAGAVFFVVYAVSVIVARLVLGRVQDRFGDNVVMYPLLGSFAVGMALLALSPNETVMVLSGVFLGVGFGGVMTSSQAIAVNMSPADRVPIGLATFYIALDLGSGVGPMLAGFVVSFVGYSGLYWTFAVAIVLTAVLYHFLHGRRPHQRSLL